MVQTVRNATTAPQVVPVSKLGITGCYIKNFGKILEQVGTDFFDEQGDKVVIKGEDFLELLKLANTSLHNAVIDCTGKEFVLELGDSPIANALEAMYRLINELSGQ